MMMMMMLMMLRRRKREKEQEEDTNDGSGNDADNINDEGDDDVENGVGDEEQGLKCSLLQKGGSCLFIHYKSTSIFRAGNVTMRVCLGAFYVF